MGNHPIFNLIADILALGFILDKLFTLRDMIVEYYSLKLFGMNFSDILKIVANNKAASRTKSGVINELEPTRNPDSK